MVQYNHVLSMVVYQPFSVVFTPEGERQRQIQTKTDRDTETQRNRLRHRERLHYVQIMLPYRPIAKFLPPNPLGRKSLDLAARGGGASLGLPVVTRYHLLINHRH